MTPIQRARKLRREMSPAESPLASSSRTSRRFQVPPSAPADPATLDFFCREAGLAIEVDGDAHDFESRAVRDVARDASMQKRGIKTVRVPAPEIFRNLQGVVDQIIEECASRTPSTG